MPSFYGWWQLMWKLISKKHCKLAPLQMLNQMGSLCRCLRAFLLLFPAECVSGFDQLKLCFVTGKTFQFDIGTSMKKSTLSTRAINLLLIVTEHCYHATLSCSLSLPGKICMVRYFMLICRQDMEKAITGLAILQSFKF